MKYSDLITCEVFQEQDYTLSNRQAVASASPNVAINLQQPPKRTETRKSFKTENLAGPEFIRVVKEHCISTFHHHQLDRCQRDSFTIMCSGLREKHIVIQMDFAENIKLVLRQQRCNYFYLQMLSFSSFLSFKKCPLRGCKICSASKITFRHSRLHCWLCACNISIPKVEKRFLLLMDSFQMMHLILR